MGESVDDLIELYRAKNLPEAHALRAELEQGNIRAIVDGEMLQGAVGELPLGWPTLPRIVVPRTDEVAARRVLAKFLEQIGVHGEVSEPPLHCLACGTVMATRNTCPECGWTYESASKTDDQTSDERGESPCDAPDAQTGITAPYRELWGEVGLVLAVTVVPYAAGFIYNFGSRAPRTIWIDAALLLIDSVCVSYVTLYLIRRRGEPWSTLGLVRFGLTDPFVGLALYLLPWALLPVVLRIVPEELDFQGQFFANPRHSWERVAVVAQYSLSAFAEELVFRAYLITRLKTLLGSTSKAIMVAAGVFALCHVY